MAKTELPIKRVVQLEIACSFCNAKLRKDSGNNDEEERIYGNNEEYHFRNNAIRQKWSAGKTREGFELTFCPDHQKLKDEMGLLA